MPFLVKLQNFNDSRTRDMHFKVQYANLHTMVAISISDKRNKKLCTFLLVCNSGFKNEK